uniref:Uncharacterized protein n=1 Tax=Anguilla anguilla TaxID=7936 RepID=A0A0E9UG66_ANGAN
MLTYFVIGSPLCLSEGEVTSQPSYAYFVVQSLVNTQFP